MAITWFFGNSGAGKTTLSDSIKTDDIRSPYYNAIRLDGDKMRGVWRDLDLSKKSRYEQNRRVARLAQMFDKMGFNVIVSVICPYAELRKEIKEQINCKFIYIEGGKEGKNYPFDKPNLYET